MDGYGGLCSYIEKSLLAIESVPSKLTEAIALRAITPNRRESLEITEVPTAQDDLVTASGTIRKPKKMNRPYAKRAATQRRYVEIRKLYKYVQKELTASNPDQKPTRKKAIIAVVIERYTAKFPHQSLSARTVERAIGSRE